MGKTKRRPSASCKHFWMQIGGKPKWFSQHCLARCKYCSSWTIIEYAGDGVGPCHHVILKEQPEELSLGEILGMYEKALGVEVPQSRRWKDLPR